MIKPEQKLVAWKQEQAIDRLSRCKAMLYIHQFITEAENRKIQERMMKWAVKHGRSGTADAP